MALTNNLKPSGFQPVGGGQLLYKWTESSLSGKTNYRVVVQFNGYTSVLPDYEFRPDATGVVWADIAPILRSLLALDETVASRMINTYVEYQAVWDESSDAEVPLSTDVIYAYVGNNHALNYRTNFDVASTDGNASMLLATGVFLSHDNLKIPEDRKFFIDFLCNGTLPATSRIKYYNRDTLTTTAVSTFDGSVIALRSAEITIATIGRYYILITNDAGTTFYGILSVEVIEVCSNPIYLRWLNDFGGLAHRMFDYNQLYNLNTNPTTKEKIIRCGAYGLSFEEWLSLNELHREGIIYNDNYKQGQFIEDVTDYDNPISLVELPISQSTETKRVGHNAEFIFRYPLIPNNEI